jgi:hypothetical protein
MSSTSSQSWRAIHSPAHEALSLGGVKPASGSSWPGPPSDSSQTKAPADTAGADAPQPAAVALRVDDDLADGDEQAACVGVGVGDAGAAHRGGEQAAQPARGGVTELIGGDWSHSQQAGAPAATGRRERR